ncbi:integrase core domain-containing protein [Rhodococcus pyridinivorans]|uniref:integrase core domain-containing protein n=1 Tax=Rhodococcus pyridinivorans TaxID=103816 RepID=UPI0037C96917
MKTEYTRPYRPQTNGKIERFHRTMAAERAFPRHYRSEQAQRTALPGWLHMLTALEGWTVPMLEK